MFPDVCIISFLAVFYWFVCLIKRFLALSIIHPDYQCFQKQSHASKGVSFCVKQIEIQHRPAFVASGKPVTL